MDDLPEPGPHAAKRGRKAAQVEVNGDQALFRFNPAALEAMQELHSLALLHSHEKFDGDAADILKDMAYANPITVDGAMSCLVTVASEAGKCYAKTGDGRVSNALHELATALNGLDGNAIPTVVTFQSPPKAKGASRD